MTTRSGFGDVLNKHVKLITARHNASDETLEAVVQTGTVWSQMPGTLCQAANTVYLDAALNNPNVAAIIADERLLHRANDLGRTPVIFSASPETLFVHLHCAHIHAVATPAPPVVHADAFVHPTAFLDDGAMIGAGARVGPHASILGWSSIGEGSVVHANAVIGADGLYAKNVEGRLTNLPHFGNVSIGRNAIVLAGAVIVRSAFHGSSTLIGEETHIGVLSNIGHDAQIGARSIISSNVVIAGRATIGKDCWIGASANIANALTVGDGAQVKIGSVVIADVPPRAVVSGNFAMDHRKNLLHFARRNAEPGSGR